MTGRAGRQLRAAADWHIPPAVFLQLAELHAAIFRDPERARSRFAGFWFLLNRSMDGERAPLCLLAWVGGEEPFSFGCLLISRALARQELCAFELCFNIRSLVILECARGGDYTVMVPAGLHKVEQKPKE